MKIEEILKGIGSFIYMERYVNEHTKSYSPFAGLSEVKYQYQPSSDFEFFDLVSVTVPLSKASIFHANPSKELFDFYVQDENIRFMIHPEIWSCDEKIAQLDQLRSLNKMESLRVSPTASTRTVLTRDTKDFCPPHFVKLHYPRRISRFNRRLRYKIIRNSVGVTKDLEQVNFEKFAYLPDCLGFTFGKEENSWGFLVREFQPRPYRQNRLLIPFFSLYGGDLEHPEDPPLIIQMIEHLNVDPQKFVVHEIMIPVLECWCKAARERGLLLESHAQNILLEVDKDFRPCRIVHRDFDIWIDQSVRIAAGLHTSDFESFISDEALSEQLAHYSLIYDHFIGREMFSYLVKTLKDFYDINTDKIRKQISQAFEINFPNAHRFFPKDTTYYFSNELLPGNKFRLIDTKQNPEWR